MKPKHAFTGIEWLLAVAIVALLAAFIIPAIGRAKRHQTAEAEPSRFQSKELTRFVITREKTPFGYPDLYVIQDVNATNGMTVLVIENSGGHLAAVKLSP